MSGRKTISLRLPRYRCGSNRRFLCRASVYCPEPPAPPKRVPIATTTPTPASPIRSRSDAASPHIGASRGHPRCSDEDDPRQRDHRRRTRAFEGIPAGFRPHGGVGGGGCARRAVHGGDVREPGNAGWTRGAAGHYQAVGVPADEDGAFEGRRRALVLERQHRECRERHVDARTGGPEFIRAVPGQDDAAAGAGGGRRWGACGSILVLQPARQQPEAESEVFTGFAGVDSAAPRPPCWGSRSRIAGKRKRLAKPS